MIPLFDTHCHIDYFEEELQNQIIKNAFDGGLLHFTTISTKVSEVFKLQNIAKKDNRIFYTIGNHPENVDSEEPLNIQALYNLYKNDSKLVAIGETGLDYYHRTDNKTKQIDEFKKHIELAKLLNKAVVVHCRNAWDDVFDIIKSSIANGFSGSNFILHCFTGSKHEVEILSELDCYISISGIVTFKNALDLQQAIPNIKQNRLIVETDSPFLAPMPHRGKQNQPLYVKYVLEEVCKIINHPNTTSFTELAKIIYQNSLNVFKINI